MNIRPLAAALLLFTTGAAHAYYGNFQAFSIYYSDTPWLRASYNAWSKTPLVANNAYKYTGISYVGYVNVPAGNHTYKFDRSTTGDWSLNYGDNNTADNCLDVNGANIAFTQGAGTYEITYNTGAIGYTCPPYKNIVKRDSFSAAQRTMFLRTSFNNWGLLPMFLVKNNVWEAEVTAVPNTQGELKFDVKGDWSLSYGRAAGSNPSLTQNKGITTQGGDNLRMLISDTSGNPNVVGKLRFNDQTREYALCAAGDTTAICQ
jgi:hypothetical protein